MRILTMDPSLGTATTSIVQNTTGAMLARQAHVRPNTLLKKTTCPRPRPESELAADIKRVFNPMYYERKRKRDGMENGEHCDDDP